MNVLARWAAKASAMGVLLALGGCASVGGPAFAASAVLALVLVPVLVSRAVFDSPRPSMAQPDSETITTSTQARAHCDAPPAAASLIC